jgi:hypothetical protein
MACGRPCGGAARQISEYCPGLLNTGPGRCHLTGRAGPIKAGPYIRIPYCIISISIPFETTSKQRNGRAGQRERGQLRPLRQRLDSRRPMKPGRAVTEFEQRVYGVCSRIPAGRVSTYGCSHSAPVTRSPSLRASPRPSCHARHRPMLPPISQVRCDRARARLVRSRRRRRAAAEPFRADSSVSPRGGVRPHTR